jgi:pimeloyl-ACP methyl ester carboxylesterase
MTKAGVPETELGEVERYFDHLVSMMRAAVPFDDVRERIEAEGFPPAFERLTLPFLPESEVEWNHMAALVDYDPRPALERIEVPVLAMFGGEDPIVPVEESVAAYREAVQPDLLTVEVFPGDDHRLQRGDPPVLVNGYLETIVSFVARACRVGTHR